MIDLKSAVGFVETLGLAAAIEAADAMVKTAEVRIAEFRLVGSGLINITVTGDVAAVKSAVEAGVSRARLVGEVLAFHVLPRPHENVARTYSREEVIS